MRHTDTGEHVKNKPCQVHQGHDHSHGVNCGHKAVKHGDHIDYEHDGHRHRVHDGHVDECEQREQIVMGENSHELTGQERKYLVGVLTELLGTQREGVYHAETSSFKDELKQEEQLIRHLIHKLEPEQAIQ